jgi:hypothetical protein
MQMPSDFDNWLTTDPSLNADELPTMCELCGECYPAGDHWDGDECPECEEGTLREFEESDPRDEPDYFD